MVLAKLTPVTNAHATMKIATITIMVNAKSVMVLEQLTISPLTVRLARLLVRRAAIFLLLVNNVLTTVVIISFHQMKRYVQYNALVQLMVELIMHLVKVAYVSAM